MLKFAAVGIDEFEVFGSRFSLLAGGIVRDYALVALDSARLIAHSTLSDSLLEESLAGIGRIWEAVRQLLVGIHGSLAIVGSNVCFSLLEHGSRRDGGVGVFLQETVDKFDFGCVAFGETQHHRLLVERIITGGVVGGVGAVVSRGRLIVALGIVVGVADSAVGIGTRSLAERL